MAIRSVNAGIRIQTYAFDETLVSPQTGNGGAAIGSNQIVVSDDIVTAGNGNIETANQGTTFVGRIIIVVDTGQVPGHSSEIIRLVTAEAAGAGNNLVLTVDEDWGVDIVTTPTNYDLYIPYTILDLTTVNGATFTARTNLTALSRPLYIGEDETGQAVAVGTAAGLQTTNADYVETSDEGNQTRESLIVLNNSTFYSGYNISGNSQIGSVITAVNTPAGEVHSQIQSGGRIRMFDSILWSQVAAINVDFQAGNTSVIKNSKIIAGTDELILNDVDLQAVGVAGQDTTTEFVRVNSGTIVNGLTITNTAGLGTVGTTTETLTLNDVAFISNTDGTNEAFIAVDSNKTWDMIDPTWNVTAIGDFDWVTTTSNRVNERRSIDATVQDKTGTAIDTARFVFYYETDDTVPATENLTSFNSNASGLVDGNWLYKQYITNSSTITSSAGAVRVDKYTYSPFAAANAITSRFTGAVTLIEDDEITQSNQALALSLSATPVTITRDTVNGHSLVKFTGGSGTLSGTITANGGAAGTFLHIVEGDSTAGWVLIDRTNTTAYVDNESLSNGAGWTATIDGTVAVAVRHYTVVIDANQETLAELYDYLAALSSSAIDDVNYGTDSTTIQKWGRGNQPRMFIKSGTTYNTLRSGTEGVLVYDYGVGNVSSFQDDDGNFYSPPASYQLELTGIKDTTEIRIHRDSDGFQLAGVESVDAGAGSGASAGVSVGGTADDNTFTYQYTYGGSDVDIYIVIISLAYEYERLDTVVLSNSNQSIPIQQRIDRNYFNP